MNLKETEGMPEKARKGYAALSIFRSSYLENKHIKDTRLGCELSPNMKVTAILYIPAVAGILGRKTWLSC